MGPQITAATDKSVYDTDCLFSSLRAGTHTKRLRGCNAIDRDLERSLVIKEAFVTALMPANNEFAANDDIRFLCTRPCVRAHDMHERHFARV